jgi:hypothetical protein
MRKWYVPLAVLAVSGLGVLFATDTGRRSLRWLAEKLDRAPETLLDWNEIALREIERIQTAVNRVAETLETAR